ncbi:2-C-methyl-D-erythritol 4-phosphate cytidylyltransferase [Clostridioides difficile]|nr:2-C-methyl-D-erythritol 4-phosphate cytidylyltransferase [Clostridioides difficile]
MYSVIIVSAGSGRRLNLDINTQFINLREKAIIAHPIQVIYENINRDEL